MKLEPEVLPKLKTQKLNRNLKTLQREIYLSNNLDTRRTFFQGCQVSKKRPKLVSQSRSIGLGPFSLSFHLMTSGLNPWMHNWFEHVFGLCGERGAIDWVRDWWGASICAVTGERGAEEIWGLGISGVVMRFRVLLGLGIVTWGPRDY